MAKAHPDLEKVIVYLKYPDAKKYIPFSSSDRKKNLETHFENIILHLVKKYSLQSVKVHGTDKKIIDSIECKLKTEHIPSLLEEKGVADVTVESKKQKLKVQSEKNWYVVKGLLVFQQQGQTKGTQLYHEEIVITQAKSLDQAVKKAKKEWQAEETPYFGGDYKIMRQKFIKVTDADYLIDQDILPEKVTPLTSSFFEEKITKDTTWK